MARIVAIVPVKESRTLRHSIDQAKPDEGAHKPSCDYWV